MDYVLSSCQDACCVILFVHKRLKNSIINPLKQEDGVVVHFCLLWLQ